MARWGVLRRAVVPATILGTGVLLGAGLASGGALASSEARRSAPQKVAEFNASGLIFKDVVEVTAVADPKIQGVTVHISNVRRSIAERLKKDFFTDPTSMSVSCSQTGPLQLLEPIALGPEGEEVFSAKKNLLFKTQRIRRVYDEQNNALLYIAYSTRLMQDMEEQNSRYRTSVSSVSLYGQNFNPRVVGPDSALPSSHAN